MKEGSGRRERCGAVGTNEDQITGTSNVEKKASGVGFLAAL